MNRKRLIAAACVLVLLAASLPAFGQEKKEEAAAPLYASGDQAISIRLGLFWPLFYISFVPAVMPSNLTLGGGGALQWGAYVTDSLTVSGEVGGTFAFSPNMNTLLMLPLLAKVEWFLTFYPFQVPLSVAAGVSFVKYADYWAVDMVLRPGASLYWIYNSSWSFGLNAEYWVSTQFSGTAGQSRIGNFLNVYLSALYRF